MLPLGDFKKLIENGVLIAIDLVCYNSAGEVLVGLRTNAPAKGYWFVPGGRIHKNETLTEAFARITQAELGCAIDASEFKFRGLYDHIYPENFFEDNSFNTHYVIIALTYQDDDGKLVVNGNDQNRSFQFMAIDTLLATDNVHPYTKNYFLTHPNNVLPLGV